MVRRAGLAVLLVLLSGCGPRDPVGAREVTPSKTRPAAPAADASARTRPPRAIATH